MYSALRKSTQSRRIKFHSSAKKPTFCQNKVFCALDVKVLYLSWFFAFLCSFFLCKIFMRFFSIPPAIYQISFFPTSHTISQKIENFLIIKSFVLSISKYYYSANSCSFGLFFSKKCSWECPLPPRPFVISVRLFFSTWCSFSPLAAHILIYI